VVRGFPKGHEPGPITSCRLKLTNFGVNFSSPLVNKNYFPLSVFEIGSFYGQNDLEVKYPLYHVNFTPTYSKKPHGTVRNGYLLVGANFLDHFDILP
jgi:hypothetical protein